MLTELHAKQKVQSAEKSQLTLLKKQLMDIEARQKNLLSAIETGIEITDSIKMRLQQLKSERDNVFLELARAERHKSIPFKLATSKQVKLFGDILQKKLTENSPFAKSYLNLLVDEIAIEGSTANMRGSYHALASAVSHGEKIVEVQVSSFIREWCTIADDNGHWDIKIVLS